MADQPRPVSYADDLAQAVFLRVSGIPGMCPFFRRMKFARAPGDPDYVGVVALETDGYGDSALMTFRGSDGRRKGCIEYTLRVGVISNAGGNNQLLADDPLLLRFRELLRTRLDEPQLKGATNMFDSEVELGAVYDDPALSGGYNSSSLRFIARVAEPLTGAAVSNQVGN